MLPPDYLEGLESQISNIYNDLDVNIVKEISKRISNVGYANTVVKNDAIVAQQAGMLYTDIINAVAENTDKSYKEIEKIFTDAGIKAIKLDDKIYKNHGLNPIPIKQDKNMLDILTSTVKQTSRNLNNLTRTTATTSQQKFIETMNEAYMQVSSGAKSYSQAIIDSIEKLSSDGSVVEYPSGYKTSLENATRMNILTGVNSNCGRMQLMRAEEMGCDLMEISAHGGARPSHAEWQGKIVDRTGKNKKYLSLHDIGYGTATGFQGVNCRHTWFPYYEGDVPTYTQSELNKINNEKVMYNGQSISKYEATQIQRKLERQIRTDKKNIAGLQSVLTSNNSDDKLMETAKSKLKQKQSLLQTHNTQLKDFVNQTNSKINYSRLKVAKNTTEVPQFKTNYLHKGEKTYKENEIYKIANSTNELLKQYTNNESKWSGKLTFSNRGLNAKLWSCNIEVERTTSTHNLLHEQLHAHSISYYNRETYKKYKKIEEGTVELYTREICKKENIEITKADTDFYDKLTTNLYQINKILKIKSNDFEFAKELFEMPVTKRLDYLEDLAYEYKIKVNNIEKANEIDKLIGELYG